MKEFIKSLLSDFDPTAFLPDLEAMFAWLEMAMRIAVLAGPLCLLGFGLWYLLAPAKEANHSVGYRFWWGMSSVEVWQFTQRLAGLVWTAVGLGMTIYMAIVCNGYRDLPREDMILSAMSLLVWELGIIVASILIINFTVIILFDHKGYRRKRKRR